MHDQPLPHRWKAKKPLPKNFDWLFSGLIFLFFLLDIVLKRSTESLLVPNQPLTHNLLFDVLYFQNTGIAFGLPLPNVPALIFSSLLICYFAYTFFQSLQTRQPLVRIASFSVLCGACSNLFDRITHGYVTDYLLLWSMSAINIADLLILFGIILFIRYHDAIN